MPIVDVTNIFYVTNSLALFFLQINKNGVRACTRQTVDKETNGQFERYGTMERERERNATGKNQ